MKRLLIILMILTVNNIYSQGIRELDLEPDLVHRITVGFKKGVTTIMFPSSIKGIYGANVVADPKVASSGDFLLSFTPGNYYFSLRSLKEKATGSLNIVYNRKIYVFELKTDNEKYDSSITMASTGRSSGGGGIFESPRSTTPSRLVSLLDKAKAYPLLKQHYPDAVGPSKLEYYIPDPKIKMEYKELDIEVKEVFRFKENDALVFAVMLTNKTQSVLTYDPRLFSARVGDHILYPTLSDATGSIPPQTKTPAYFVICGSPKGGRNNLSARNDWSVYLTINKYVDEWADSRKYIDEILQKRKESYYESKNPDTSTGDSKRGFGSRGAGNHPGSSEETVNLSTVHEGSKNHSETGKGDPEQGKDSGSYGTGSYQQTGSPQTREKESERKEKEN